MLRLLLAALLMLAPAAARAGDVTIAAETVKLWPGAPPGHGRPDGPERIGSEGSATGAYTNISTPRMEVYRPPNPNGAAVLVLPGGGYFRLQIGSAAKPIARWLLGEGVTAAVLYYRLPGDGWNADAPFQDGQRAMRLLRANAARLGIDPDRIGVIGTSAGGHLGGILATRGEDRFYEPVDAADSLSATPHFAGLVYPVISLRPPIDTTRTKRNIDDLPDAIAAFSVEEQVDASTPPVFLAHSADDPIADVEHSLRMFDAMRAAARPVELHVFETGGHSWGLGKPGTAVTAWSKLFEAWAEGHGWFEAADR